jgi:hypothetical protein
MGERAWRWLARRQYLVLVPAAFLALWVCIVANVAAFKLMDHFFREPPPRCGCR